MFWNVVKLACEFSLVDSGMIHAYTIKSANSDYFGDNKDVLGRGYGSISEFSCVEHMGS